MDNERYNQWIHASYVIGGTDQRRSFIMVAIQGLARLDCTLIADDERFAQLPEYERATIPVAMELTERLTLSHLWVLGAYEVIRTLDQLIRAETPRADSSLQASVTATKHLYERLRIPLAKMEASRRNPDDSPIAYPVLMLAGGFAWQLAENVVVSRRQLSDAFLSLLIAIRAKRE